MAMSEEFLPPPGLLRVDVLNLGPVIDPKFTDARDWSEFLPHVDTTPVYFEERDVSFIDAARGAAPEIAFATSSVRELLDRKRYEVISVGTRTTKDDSEHPVVVIYNYSDDHVIEVMVDGGHDGQRKSVAHMPTAAAASLRNGRMIEAETETAEIPIKKTAQVVLPMGSTSVIAQSSKMPRAFRLMRFELEWFEGKPLPPSFHVLRRSVGIQSALIGPDEG